MKYLHTETAKIVMGILVTGAFLNLAGSGKFGTQIQKFANYVTKGYGAA